MLKKITKAEFKKTMDNFIGKPMSIYSHGVNNTLTQFNELEFEVGKDINDIKSYCFEDGINFVHINLKDIKKINCELEDNHLEIILSLKYGQVAQIFNI